MFLLQKKLGINVFRNEDIEKLSEFLLNKKNVLLITGAGQCFQNIPKLTCGKETAWYYFQGLGTKLL